MDHGIAFDYYGDLYKKYTPLGELIHDIKYESLSQAQYNHKLQTIFNSIENKLLSFQFLKNEEDLIVCPMPPTHRAKMRQPVFELAKMIAEALNRPYEQDLIIKNTSKKAKNMPINEFFKESDFTINPPHYKTSVLIIDDTYGQGKTLKAVSELLRKHQNIEKIYFISMVKNLGKGLLGR